MAAAGSGRPAGIVADCSLPAAYSYSNGRLVLCALELTRKSVDANLGSEAQHHDLTMLRWSRYRSPQPDAACRRSRLKFSSAPELERHLWTGNTPFLWLKSAAIEVAIIFSAFRVHHNIFKSGNYFQELLCKVTTLFSPDVSAPFALGRAMTSSSEWL